MAEDSFSRFYQSVQPGKLQLYSQQCSINLALEQVALGCKQLQTLNIIPRGFIALYANMTEELRALINCKVIETMLPIEQRDAKIFQDARLKWESRPYPRIPRMKTKKKK